MGKADGDGAAPYNYAHFDDYVAAGGDLADEAAFWASPRACLRARPGDGRGQDQRQWNQVRVSAAYPVTRRAAPKAGDVS